MALGAGRAMQGMWYDVGAMDPAAFTVVAVTLLASALLACFIPAAPRRSIRWPPFDSSEPARSSQPVRSFTTAGQGGAGWHHWSRRRVARRERDVPGANRQRMLMPAACRRRYS
jgi:hypothetical protein